MRSDEILFRLERSLLPSGEIWTHREGGDFSKLLEALSVSNALPLPLLLSLEGLERAEDTKFLEEAETEYGVPRDPLMSQEERRRHLAAYLVLARGGSLQSALHTAGYRDLFVHGVGSFLNYAQYVLYWVVGRQEGLLKEEEFQVCFLVAGGDSGFVDGYLSLGEEDSHLGSPAAYCGNHTSRFKGVYYTETEIERITKIVERAKSLFSLGILVITRKENEDA